MSRLRTELVVLAIALPLWMALTKAPAPAWPLTLGTVMGLLVALALTLPRPWNR